MNECVNGQELWCFLSDYVLVDPREDGWRSIMAAIRVFADCWLAEVVMVVGSPRSEVLLVKCGGEVVFRLTRLEDDDYPLLIWCGGDYDFFKPVWG